jgi:hypothetical protein
MRLVVEHKTSSEDIGPGSSYWKRLVVDIQIATYLDGAEGLGVPCDGVLYDVLRKPQHKPSVAKSEKPEYFSRRVFDAICEKPAYYYQRREIVRLEDERKENALDRWQTAASIRDARRSGVFPRNADACVTWNRACDFLPVCSGEASADDPLLYRAIEHANEELPEELRKLPLVTQSSLRCYRSCPRKYYYRYEKRLRALTELAKPLRVGRSIHAGLEAWWKTGGDVEAALRALTSEDVFDRARENAMILGYHAHWSEAQKTITAIGVEKAFRLPLVNPLTDGASRTFELGGVIDVICERA